ncbi:MAG: peptidylprolyl isomerase [Lachnospiraceae bacterium]|nr:peptidylprolyl isomerase [Lachnospiraceae bacterium]
MKKHLLAVLCFGVVLAGCTKDAGTTTVQTTAVNTEAEAPEQENEKQEKVYATIDIKDFGTIRLELYPEYAPITVENFTKLAESGFYDGLTFHRIMEGFMMQGGDPTGTGYGDPSQETIKGEFAANGVNNPISHTRGAISMARADDPNSASSQFFIVHKDSTFLDGNYAAFGMVTEGIEVVDAVCETAQPIDNNGTIPAEAQPVINSIKISKE